MVFSICLFAFDSVLSYIFLCVFFFSWLSFLFSDFPPPCPSLSSTFSDAENTWGEIYASLFQGQIFCVDHILKAASKLIHELEPKSATVLQQHFSLQNK